MASDGILEGVDISTCVASPSLADSARGTVDAAPPKSPRGAVTAAVTVHVHALRRRDVGPIGDAAAAPNCTSVRYNWYRDWKSELVWVVMYTCHTRAVIGDVNVALWSPPMLLSHTKADPGTVTNCEAAFWYRNSRAPNE